MLGWDEMHALFSASGKIHAGVNGSQLAKMEKSIPHMSLPWNYRVEAVGLKKIQLYLKKYDSCGYVKFWAISWKINILSITA